jgi:hypothetical protein
MVGVYDTVTRKILYNNIEPRPITGMSSPTYKSAADVLVYNKPKQLSTKLNIAGKAGSYANNVSFTITPSSATFSGTKYSTSVIVVSSWPFFDALTTYNTSSIIEVTPKVVQISVSNLEQSPLSRKLGD